VCIDARADLTGPQTQSEKAKTDSGAKATVHPFTTRASAETECGLPERVPEREGAHAYALSLSLAARSKAEPWCVYCRSCGPPSPFGRNPRSART
jgi:hypothetical protein